MDDVDTKERGSVFLENDNGDVDTKSLSSQTE
jgi:hypothetical protein